MRKIYFLILLSGWYSIAGAQFQRTVLLEEFTQASCGPCALQNETFNPLVAANYPKVASIAYHVSWPGIDPMYLMNTEDVDHRVAYYGISGVPHVKMDGSSIVNDCELYDGAPGCLDQTEIDVEYSLTSPLQIAITRTFSDDYQVMHIHIDIFSSIAITGDLKLRTVITEKDILFGVPPGSNGENDFPYVMKKMLPGDMGISTGNFAAGETKSYDFDWDVENVYDLNTLSVIAFVQNDDTREVLQAGESATEILLAGDDYCIVTAPVYETQCESGITPVVYVYNQSLLPITSMDFKYQLDGGPWTSYYSWTGTLASFSYATINLPLVTVDESGYHSLKIKLWSNSEGVDLCEENNAVNIAVNTFIHPSVALEEGFESGSFPPALWGIQNLAHDVGWWSAAAGAHGLSEHSAEAKAWFVNSAPFDLLLPEFDLTGVMNDTATITFERAYAKRNNDATDALDILVSTDCGETWNAVYHKESNDLHTAPVDFESFVPENDQWKADTADISAYIGQNILVKFSMTPHYGNNLYIDDVNLNAVIPSESISEINPTPAVFPNPASDHIIIDPGLIYGAEIHYEIYRADGQLVQVASRTSPAEHTLQINTSMLPAGYYFVKIYSADHTINTAKAFVIQK